MLRVSILLAFILSGVVYGPAQGAQVSETLAPAAGKLTLSQLATAAKAYLRDSAELPLDMQLSMLAVDGSSRTIKKDHATGRYDFHGYNLHSENANASMRVQTKGFLHSAKGMLPAAWNSFIAGILPSTVLSMKAEEEYSLEMADPSAASHLVTAKITPPPGSCSEFKWSIKHVAPETFCGTSKFELQKDDLSLQHFSFDAGGLPLATEVKPFGRCQLRGYHVEVEFQKVTLAGDPKPFLVPKQVEVTIDTDKGKVVMSSEFAPRK